MLNAGTRLGSYEVIALLGAGGMGEVYRARDTRLGRSAGARVTDASEYRCVLMIKDGAAQEPFGPSLTVIENWTEDLKKLAK